ncbi:tRNA (guanosine(46)-N7)-methyltransferase TrmB [Arthrobacter sp. zg-Y750]|uniref:tRNA (guanosine(46)-N7)-methyltransferase TrmB n=1 Tax=Arthrobacter sp. zg-Y750 TaxID=2894189 RepID=UPI001E4F57C1|nr:tRNA (guanosine(46)-N7)-methyltransferase TrmB [Arthrobacter sp. zg-Y750]MCC9176580.1 tRNA (guanosine(46)-N7)-methyltransferase TrmB [Arthrobacter sp. zg-Y750]
MTTEPALPQAEGTDPDIDVDSETGEDRHFRSPVSFVRRGSRLQGRRQQAWDELSDRFVVDVPREEADTSVHPEYVFDAAAEFGRTAPLVVEIGSGLGEAVTHAAEQNPDKDFLAVEVYLPGLAQTLQRIGQKGLTNVRVVQANAPEVLTSMLPAGSVDEVWVFFPDPWHKTRHHKRRLVKESFAELVARVLVPGGTWRLATDWSDYAVQMREVLDASEQFENLHTGEQAGEQGPLTRVHCEGLENKVPEDDVDERGGWAPRFEGRTLTSFENKAHQAGRLIFDLAYRRI